MPMSSLRKDEAAGRPAAPPGLGELDRVRLRRDVSDRGRTLASGLKGTIVLCHGADAYEVEFDAIDDEFFQIPADDLEKA